MELDMTGEKPVRVENPSELISGVVAYQQASAMTNRLHTRNISDDGEILMHLCSPQTQTPRYSIYVLDKPGKKAGKTYTVFIVPQGRYRIYFTVLIPDTSFSIAVKFFYYLEKPNGILAHRRVVRSCLKLWTKIASLW